MGKEGKKLATTLTAKMKDERLARRKAKKVVKKKKEDSPRYGEKKKRHLRKLQLEQARLTVGCVSTRKGGASEGYGHLSQCRAKRGGGGGEKKEPCTKRSMVQGNRVVELRCQNECERESGPSKVHVRRFKGKHKKKTFKKGRGKWSG